MMELKIYFKNVGQGDTIFVHWDTEKKFGLIDCNVVNGGIDPVIKHIERFDIRVLHFVVLSHPHTDHYSGLPLLFDYCKTKGIVIENFYHTAVFHKTRLTSLFKAGVTKRKQNELLLSAVNENEGRRSLFKLFGILGEQSALNGKGFIKCVEVINAKILIPLGDDYNLTFLAPYQYDEHDRYIKANYDLSTGSFVNKYPHRENNPLANILSTIIQISTSDYACQVLLCSDSTEYTFLRIAEHEYRFKQLTSTSLVGFQIPHHGSSENHVPDFWKAFDGLKTSHAFISVGEGYGHPSSEVVGFFDVESQKVHSTNYVGGYRSYYEDKENEDFDLVDFNNDIMNMFDQSAKIEMREGCGEKILSLKKELSGKYFVYVDTK